MFTASFHSILTRTALAVLLPVVGPSAQAFSAQVSGCQLLHDQAAVICKAKISCRDAVEAVEAVRPLFTRCAAGDFVRRHDVEDAIGAFKNPRYFRCCIGNDLVSLLPSAVPFD